MLRLAAAAYLARYKGTSRIHMGSDLRIYFGWCAERGLDPLAVERPHLELYVRWMQEVRRFQPSTVSRRLSVIAGLYRTCVIDGILAHSPAEYVRRPAVPAESPTLGFTHLQFEALLTTARDSANLTTSRWLRCSAAGPADLRSHRRGRGRSRRRTWPPGPAGLRQGSKVVLVPLPPAVGRAIDRAIAGRGSGPLLLNNRGARMDRHAATRRLRHLATTAGVRIGRAHPHMLRHTFVTTMQMSGVASRASFGTSGEHALPAVQRTLVGRTQSDARPCSPRDPRSRRMLALSTDPSPPGKGGPNGGSV